MCFSTVGQPGKPPSRAVLLAQLIFCNVAIPYKLSIRAFVSGFTALDLLKYSTFGSMPSNELRAAVLREIGCSDSTYNRVYSDLTKSSQIAKQAIRGKDGRNRWYTCYCGETSDKVPF